KHSAPGAPTRRQRPKPTSPPGGPHGGRGAAPTKTTSGNAAEQVGSQDQQKRTEEPMKRLLTIGQVAARLGRSVDFVRQRTDDGELQAEPRGKGQYRHYTQAAVAAYEAKQRRHRRPLRAHPQPKRASPPPRPPRPVRPPVDPRPFADDDPFWDEPLDVEPSAPLPPRAPSPIERVFLDMLITGGILAAPWGLPEEWRGKLQADLERYVTLERFPMGGSATSASTAIRHHVEAVLTPYHDAKKKEEEQKRAREAAARAAE